MTTVRLGFNAIVRIQPNNSIAVGWLLGHLISSADDFDAGAFVGADLFSVPAALRILPDDAL